MSKKISGKQTNTLLNYFQSPKNAKPKEQQLNKSAFGATPPKKPALSRQKAPEALFKEKSPLRDDSDNEAPAASQQQKKKRIRAIVDSSDDSDSENTESLKKARKETVPREHSLREAFAFNANHSPQTPKRDIVSTRNPTSKKNEEAHANGARWLHETLDFLRPEKIRDAEGRKPTDSNYDPHTLYVPPDFLAKQTPGMRQWWTLKSKYADAILFFKMGKFYELYHMDASIGVRHLGFSYMKGDFAHSGFPEIAYSKMATILINLGFKVVRIEQTETPDMLAERVKKQSGKKDKVVRREICQVSSKATCIYNQQITTPLSPAANYLMAVTEKRESSGRCRYGVVFVDTSIGIFHVGDFEDDKQSSRLLSLLAQHPPVLIITERGRIAPQTVDLLQKNTARIKFESLTPDSQFYSAEKTIKLLQEADYFKKSTDDDTFIWPRLFEEELLDHGSPSEKYSLAFKCIGALVWYLKNCLIDVQVFSMSQFELYIPLDILTPPKEFKRDFMILDHICISNLNLIGGSGTLQQTLDHCRTAFGKRLLTHWICRPLADIQKIQYRQEAIKELIDNPFVLREASQLLSKMPDLERQIMKINTFGNKYYSRTHPDSRAVMYELKTYTKRKITDLLTTLKGFRDAMAVIDMFQDFKTRFIVKLTQIEPKGAFVDVSDILDHFGKSFDAEEALAKGQILPKSGLDETYDTARDNIAVIQRELDDYLTKQRRLFGNEVVYFGRDKNRFQLEIPEKKCKNISHDYFLEGAKKGSKPAKRYSTQETRELLGMMMKAEHERDLIIADLNRRIFEQFSSYYPKWERVTQSLTVLDVLCSLANYVASSSQEMCLPTVLPFAENPSLQIEDGCHPCIRLDNYVSNHTKFGVDDHSNILLLTGPNMGGKSTLMRQVALLVIMAQIGSYVPATSCTLTAVDRVFTRVGARDDIIRGESTFLTEMLESSCILRHATSHSLLLVDELGRGTTTHDGTAIAAAYVNAVRSIKARTFFSTHYHSLVEHYDGMEGVQTGHMACFVEQEDNRETVTFLYKLTQGQCPKSYGFNVATLAGLPQAIVSVGRQNALDMENTGKCRSIITLFRTAKTVGCKRELLLAMQLLELN